MARNLARKATTAKTLDVVEAKAKVLELIASGCTVDQACRVVQRSVETYRDWRKHDAEFKAKVDGLRRAMAEVAETGKPAVPDFPEFCRDYLGQPLFIHQLRMLDVIEGREPRDLHDSMTYRAAYPDRILINVPPYHAKSTTFTVNYVVWRIVKDPSIRVLIISEGMKLAQEFLYEIKQKLTSSVYQEMHIRFAPEGGFQGDEWGQTKIRVAGAQDDGAQKDPTVQALGMKGQIYGRRADLVIMDDTVTTKSAAMIDIQTRLIDREIESRLDDGAPLIVLGTRIAPHDLYRELIDQVDGDEKPIWTYFRQPAVLDYGNGDSATWTTLWPEKWPGTSLVRRKKAGNWNLVYQQMNVDDEMTFRVEAIEASINSGRFPGPLCGQDQRVRVGDLYVSNSDLYVVGGIDPASVGCTAMIVAGLHVESGKRFVLDGVNIPNCPPHILKENIKRLTDLHHINEWVIERNAFQGFLSRDRDLLDWLRSRGCKVTEHYTTGNKRDSDFGIATMGPLFDTCGEPDPKHPSGRWRKTPDRALIDLPSPRQNEWVHELTQQLTAWQPQGMAQHAKTDLVMAMWFTHIRFTEILDRKRQKITHLSSPFLSRSARKRQTVINLAELRAEKRLQELEGTAV